METTRDNGLADLSGLSVLVVDDDADNRVLLEMLLTRQGAHVVSASGAAEGLQALGQQCPDVVISDLQMIGGDGFGFLQCVRSSTEDYPRFVPAIAVSSVSSEEHRRRAREAGFWRYLEKPVLASTLCDEVAKLAAAHKRFQRAQKAPPIQRAL